MHIQVLFGHLLLVMYFCQYFNAQYFNVPLFRELLREHLTHYYIHLSPGIQMSSFCTFPTTFQSSITNLAAFISNTLM